LKLSSLKVQWANTGKQALRQLNVTFGVGRENKSAWPCALVTEDAPNQDGDTQ
jgi:hypothetical protein